MLESRFADRIAVGLGGFSTTKLTKITKIAAKVVSLRDRVGLAAADIDREQRILLVMSSVRDVFAMSFVVLALFVFQSRL